MCNFGSTVYYTTIKYNDLSIKLAGSLVMAHFIDSLGRTESFFQRLATRQYYINLFVGFVNTMALWEVVRRTILYLDQRWPLLQHIVQRIVLQLILVVALPALDGKILVELEPSAKEPVVVNQKRAKAFREWIGGA